MKFPNADQVTSLVRKAGAAIGPLLMITGAIPQAKWQPAVDAIANSVGPLWAAIGAVALIGSTIWGFVTRSDGAKIAAVNNTVDGVKVVSDTAISPTVTVAPPAKV